MQNLLVLTIIGKDHTGLVESVAQLIAKNEGNWLESRMCHLGGEFAGILRIQVPKEKEQPLTQALQVLNSQGLTVIIRPDETRPSERAVKNASLSLTGHDRPGIVYQISSVLAQQNVNVETLETECYSAPMTGENIFTAIAQLKVPESCRIENLREELEKLGEELMIDISFTET